jgi:hypothetical protein
MDEDSLRTDLAACELTDGERAADFDSFDNPFPEAEGEELTV